jgi:hypothetical protein
MQGMGLVAAKLQDEQVRWAGVGRRSTQDTTAPDLNTPFELGSITKTFTALLLADMTLRGELGLDDAVESVLPGALRLLDTNGAAITFGCPPTCDSLTKRTLTTTQARNCGTSWRTGSPPPPARRGGSTPTWATACWEKRWPCDTAPPSPNF